MGNSIDADDVELLLLDTQRHLVDWAVRIAAGDAVTGVVSEVRETIDELTCMLDEGPEDMADRLHYNIDRCEALLKRLAN